MKSKVDDGKADLVYLRSGSACGGVDSLLPEVTVCCRMTSASLSRTPLKPRRVAHLKQPAASGPLTASHLRHTHRRLPSSSPARSSPEGGEALYRRGRTPRSVGSSSEGLCRGCCRPYSSALLVTPLEPALLIYPGVLPVLRPVLLTMRLAVELPLGCAAPACTTDCLRVGGVLTALPLLLLLVAVEV